MDSNRPAPDRRPPTTTAVRRSALRRPFRFWMTGSLAVVMAALGPAPRATDAEATDAVEPERVLRLSRYGVAETAQRIVAAAREGGLSVLWQQGGAQPVLVLASSVGGTLVVMDEASARIEVPFSVRLRQGADAAGEAAMVAVTLAGLHHLDGRWGDLPPAVVADLGALPELIDRALA